MKYTVIVADNFHYMDESEQYVAGTYDDYEAAVRLCKTIVDEYLTSAFKPPMTAAELYSSYTTFGEDPYITGDVTVRFSAWDYAKERCETITKAV